MIAKDQFTLGSLFVATAYVALSCAAAVGVPGGLKMGGSIDDDVATTRDRQLRPFNLRRQ